MGEGGRIREQGEQGGPGKDRQGMRAGSWNHGDMGERGWSQDGMGAGVRTRMVWVQRVRTRMVWDLGVRTRLVWEQG